MVPFFGLDYEMCWPELLAFIGDGDGDSDGDGDHLEETPTARTSSPGSKLTPLSSLGGDHVLHCFCHHNQPACLAIIIKVCFCNILLIFWNFLLQLQLQGFEDISRGMGNTCMGNVGSAVVGRRPWSPSQRCITVVGVGVVAVMEEGLESIINIKMNVVKDQPGGRLACGV